MPASPPPAAETGARRALPAPAPEPSPAERASSNPVPDTRDTP